MNIKHHSDLFANFVLCGLNCFDGNKFPNVNLNSSPFEESFTFMNKDIAENWSKFKLFWLDRTGNTLSSLIILELCTCLSNSSKNEYNISLDDVKKVEHLLEEIEDICLPRIIFKFERFKLLSLVNLVASSPEQDLENFIAALKIKSSFCDSVTEENLKEIVIASPGIDEFCKQKLLDMLDNGKSNDDSEKFPPLGSTSYEDKNISKSVLVKQNVQAVFKTDLMAVLENAVKEESSKSPSKKRLKGISRSQHEKRKKISEPSDSGEGNELVREKIDSRTCSEKLYPEFFKAKLRSHTKTSVVECQNTEGKGKKPLKFNSFEESDSQDKSCVASSVKENKKFPPNETLQQIVKFKKTEDNKTDTADPELLTNKLDEKNYSSLGMKGQLVGDSQKIFEPPKKLYTCDKCFKVFSSQSSFKLHQNTHRQQKCDICQASFQGQAKLNRHRLTHTGEKPYKCQSCGSTFADRSHLNVHHRIHSGLKPFKCNICKASFSESTKLKNHKRIHSGEKPYVCEICGSSFSVSSSMKSHMKIHSGQKPYKCQLCEFASTHMSNLKTHMLSHSGEKKHACDVCGVSFTETAKLRRHKMVHTGEKPYNCEVCGARFADKSHLTVHLRIHSGEKPFKCTYCPSAFIESTKLKNHLRTHTGEKPYMCEVCGMSFAVSYSLKSHLRKHTGEKPYRCKLCGYATSQSSNLKTHMLVHNGKKPHVCQECGASFSEPSKLNRHKKIHLDLDEDADAPSSIPKRTITDFPQNNQRHKTDSSPFIHQEFKAICSSKSQSIQSTAGSSPSFSSNTNLSEHPVHLRHNELREEKSYRSNNIETETAVYQYHNHQDVDNDYQHPYRNMICCGNPNVEHHGEELRESYPNTNMTIVDQYHTTPNNQMSFSNTKLSCHPTSSKESFNFSSLYKPTLYQPPSGLQIELINL